MKSALALEYFLTPKGNSPIEEYMAAQDDEALAAIRVAIRAFLLEFPQLLHVAVRPVRGKIWEIKVRDPRGVEHRLFYTVSNATLFLLHAFTKKTPKAPPEAIALAEKRMKSLGL
jgi:phage-related protein